MPRSFPGFFILSLLALFFLTSGGVSDETNFTTDNTDLWTTVQDAYVYCVPLVLVDATMKKLTNTVEATNIRAPVNQLIYNNVLFNADTKVVVSPNVDNIYSSAFLDLNNTALVFVKPKTDRYCSVQVMDAYTNTVYVAGSGSKSGNPEDEVTFVITGRDYQGEVPDGMIHISIPTEMAWIIIRTVINGPEDLPNVEAVEKQMLLMPLKDYLNNQTYLPEKGTFSEEYNYDPVDHVLNMSAEEFFNTANVLMMTNPPASADSAIINEMQSINVGPGLNFNDSVLGPDGGMQWNAMLKNLVPDLTNQTEKYVTLYGKWKNYGDPIGDWGTAYAYRALIAIIGLGGNPSYVAVYPLTMTDSEGQQLSGSNRYRLHIDTGMLPPVVQNGFWSFTVYGTDNFLIPNEINRYCINDRSNVTVNSDGSLDILLQAEKPDDTILNNWLPVGTGDFRVNLRIYGPDLEKFENDWTAPEIYRVS